jgi:hypothetical protein
VAEQQCKPEDGESKGEALETRFGIRGNLGGNMADGFNFPSFGGGITLLVPLSSVYLVQELSFVNRTVKLGADIKETLLEVPMIFRFRHNKDNLVFLGIGPLFSFILSSEASGSNKYYLSRPSIDFGIATEFGFRLGNHFTIDIRTLHSLTDYEYYEYSYNPNGGYYNTEKEEDLFYQLQFQLGVSVLF